MAPPRLMLLHALAPPTPGGTPVVLGRLLTNLPGVAVDVVTDRRLRARVRAGGPGVLDARYRFVRKWPGWGGRWRFGRRLIAAIDFILALVAGVRAARWARRDRVRWVLSVTDEGFSVIAGTVAARLAGLPHVVMAFDLWEENAYTEVQRAVAARLEPRIFRSAAAVVGYCRRSSSITAPSTGSRRWTFRPPWTSEVSQSRANRPSMTDHARCSSSAPCIGLSVTRWPACCRCADASRACGWSPSAARRPCGTADCARIARSRPCRAPNCAGGWGLADVLFLGLSLSSDHPAIVRTATPARLVEYMASGRPPLVHAPTGSHVAEYARREDFAEVVDVADPEAAA